MEISDYLKDPKGNASSKRLMSYQLMWFFIAFNAIMWPVLALLTFTNAEISLDANWLLGLLGFDFLLLIAMFAPTQLSKIQEVKEIIELAKNK